MSILIDIATFILILVSIFLVMVVLAQKATSDGGMGAAMGGGMAEAAFGAETSNVLTKSTIRAAVVFFLLSFLVYLGNVYQHKHIAHAGSILPTIPGSSLPALPATSAAPVTAPLVHVNPTPAAPVTTPATQPANK